jgi:hypothetical protein
MALVLVRGHFSPNDLEGALPVGYFGADECILSVGKVFSEKAGRAVRSMDACVSFTVKLTPPIVRRPPSVHMLLEIENGHGVRLCCPVPWEATPRLGTRLPTQALYFQGRGSILPPGPLGMLTNLNLETA